MTELHMIVSVEQGVRRRTRDALTEITRRVHHPPNFMGGTREMESLNEDDVPSDPPEVTLPPTTADKELQRIQELLTEAWNLMATRDRTNMEAFGTITVDGRTLAEDVPLSTLLALEKQLHELRAIIDGMPVRNPTKLWTLDPDQGFYRTPEVRKPRTRKTVTAVTLYEATKEHPAQVHAIPQDRVVGHYKETEFSGAISKREKEDILDRVNKLIDAVRAARTEANTAEVIPFHPAGGLLGYIFGG